MSTAHTLLAQALAAYDAADASWKPAEWFESVRVYLATPVDQRPAPDYPLMRAAFQTSESGNGRYKAVFQFPTLQCMQAAVMQWHGVQKPLPSPAWCASVDAEMAATAEADAAFSQHASDSKELRRLCQERDDLRRANSLHKVDIAALESSVGHLSTLVDELRRLLGAAMQTMTDLHESATPDESTADIDAHIPGAAFAKFVNEHAQLLFEIKNGCAAAPVFIFPATAVAEGLDRDGDALEQAE